MMGPFDYEANKHLLVDSRGIRLTAALFEELARPDATVKPVFRLSDWRKAYVEIGDPTDYAAAMFLLGDWDHWQLLLSNKEFAEHVARWRMEVEVKVRSEAIKQMAKHARQPGGAAAAKWLAEAGFVQRDKRKKQDREDDESTAREAKASVAADAKRLGLVAVK